MRRAVAILARSATVARGATAISTAGAALAGGMRLFDVETAFAKLLEAAADERGSWDAKRLLSESSSPELQLEVGSSESVRPHRR